MRKFYCSTFAFILLLLCSSCSTPPEAPKMKLVMGVPAGKMKYEKISSEFLSLNLLTTPVVYAGKSASLIFALRNFGSKEIKIQEWYKEEPDNIIMYIQPYLPGMKAPDPDAWIEINDVNETKQRFHYPLSLMPDNQVMVTKKLPFISKIRISPGKERRFFLKAKLNLKSVDLSSDVIVIKVLPEK